MGIQDFGIDDGDCKLLNSPGNIILKNEEKEASINDYDHYRWW